MRLMDPCDGASEAMPRLRHISPLRCLCRIWTCTVSSRRAYDLRDRWLRPFPSLSRCFFASSARLPHPRLVHIRTMGATPPPTVNGTSAGTDKQLFKAEFPDLVDTLINDLKSSFDLPQSSIDYIHRNLTYNVPHGKLNRGMAVLQCYQAFNPDQQLTDEQRKQAVILGWCVELLQAFFLVADDIMDDSITRRGQPCFYRIPEIGMNAINDAMILEMMIYRLLKIHFRQHPQYLNLLELFSDITYTTEMGQLLDLTTSQPADKVLLPNFTEENLTRIYRYKTSHYTFYLPVALGMRLASVTDDALYDTAKDICMRIGYYFQAQDDFLDAFGDPSVTGKIGTDIEDNTCTWLVVRALERCSEEDRLVLEQNYGKKDTTCSNRVKDLYRKLDLPKVFAAFEQSSYEDLSKRIADIQHMPTGAFEFFLAKLYKRNR
ncbi:Isoprenoid synthase [Gracilaria domingensis]|nr:Isoprenoid synthase [Gracilaria domingensis]